MSAYVVDEGHIRYLVEAALRLRRDEPISWMAPDGTHVRLRAGEVACPGIEEHSYLRDAGERWETYRRDVTATWLGRMLWRECFASVRHRYPQEGRQLPGPVPTPDPENYEHEWSDSAFDPVQVLKAISCYEYQSCETEDWETSEAHEVCGVLRSVAISCLPGWEAAAWGPPGSESRRLGGSA